MDRKKVSKSWKAKIQAIQDPIVLLREIIDAIDGGYFGHDPYFNNIKETYMNRARDLVKPESRCEILTPPMKKLLHDIDYSPDGHVLMQHYNKATVTGLLTRGIITLLMHRRYGPRKGKVIRRRKNNEYQNPELNR